MNDLKIIIPTRQRARAVKRTLFLIPSATLLLHESEKDEYVEQLGHVPIITHNITGSLAKIRQYALDTIKEDCVFFCDDDLKAVRSLQSTTVYKDSDVILQIILNGYRIAKDLGLSLFSFNRNANPIQYYGCDPIGLAHTAAGAFGVIGRDINFDCRLTTREDVDFTMQVLLKNRITIQDRRFYFDFGPVWKGEGGNQGLRTSDREADDIKLLWQKWGYLLKVGVSDNRVRKKNNAGAMSIRVSRKQ